MPARALRLTKKLADQFDNDVHDICVMSIGQHAEN